jgi:hypothetical protein
MVISKLCSSPQLILLENCNLNNAFFASVVFRYAIKERDECEIPYNLYSCIEQRNQNLKL